MHFEVVYASGLSGFIGKNLLPHLIKNFPKVVNFRKGELHEIYLQDGSIKIEKNKNFSQESGKKLFINIAALYNSSPKTQEDLYDLYESNALLPVKIIENYIGSDNLKIIQLGSYFQLLDYQYQSPYSLTKSLGSKYLAANYSNLSHIYLFDTFGTSDNRNRVIDTFINKILKKEPIKLPKKDVIINISHVSEVCGAIFNCIDLPPNNYCIMSNNNLTLKNIAIQIMKIIGNTVDIEDLPHNVDLLSKLNKDDLPMNIFPATNENTFDYHLKSRIDEIRFLNS